MREILFRGKDPESGTWYEGYYMALSDTTYCFQGDYAAHPDNTKHYIVFDRMTDWGLPNQHLRADVDPVTVGQYTGLKDTNGKKIFEGDFVISTNPRRLSNKPELVEYNPSSGYWMCDPRRGPLVVGNVYDNQEPSVGHPREKVLEAIQNGNG